MVFDKSNCFDDFFCRNLFHPHTLDNKIYRQRSIDSFVVVYNKDPHWSNTWTLYSA